MSRTPRTLWAIAIALGVAVPAAWHPLGANIEIDGKKLRAHPQSFAIDGTRVTLDVDRSLVVTGDTVTATLVAYGDTPAQIALDLRVGQTHVRRGEPPPPRQIDREKITLVAAPGGGKPTKVRLVLGTARKALGREDRFEIYVSPHGDRPPPTADEYGERSRDWEADVEAGHAAVADVTGWSGNSISMKVTAEGPIAAKQPFVVAVRVKNTTGVALPHPPVIALVAGDSLRGATDPDAHGAEDDVEIEPLFDPTAAGEPAVARGAETVRRFRVTPKRGQTEIALAVRADACDRAGAELGAARDVVAFRADAGTKIASR